MGGHGPPEGPDFTSGVRISDIPDGGMLAGRVGDEPVLLSRIGGELHAVGGACTHYGAALSGGLVAGDSVRCPLHHACFSLRTGAALRAPAMDPLGCWRAEVEGGRVFVRQRLPEAAPSEYSPATPGPVVIVGGGAAGFACAAELRRRGFQSSITLLSADSDPPCDRPNLSKDYLAGTAEEAWIPLRDPAWYADQTIDLRLGVRATCIDLNARAVQCDSGEAFPFGCLLLATGSDARQLPGFDAANVFTLRSPGDARAIIAEAKPGSRAAIIGSSFIGLECAAALRARGIEVDVISPEAVPFEDIFGAEVGTFLQRLHERNGVRFHLGETASSYDGEVLRFSGGNILPADFVVVGIGARPCTELARSALIHVEDGVLVDEHLETNVPGIYAAGDIASYPDPWTGARMRIEHWVHAQRQGQVAAANMIGLKRRFDAVPFFWTEQFGVALRYVGHSRDWQQVEIDGNLAAGNFAARYHEDGVHRASAFVGRDRECLEDELRLERDARSRAATNAREPASPQRHPMRA